MTKYELDNIERLVFKACEEHPDFVRRAIDAATEGVKKFADNQSDTSTDLAYIVSSFLDIVKTKKVGAFTRKHILNSIDKWFGGTKWMENQWKGF